MKRTRTKTGCLNCRARRKKCDETKPSCSRCQTCGDSCTWEEAFPFRSTGISAEHPSMQQQRHMERRRSELQIVDVDFDRVTKRRKTRSFHDNEHADTVVDSASALPQSPQHQDVPIPVDPAEPSNCPSDVFTLTPSRDPRRDPQQPAPSTTPVDRLDASRLLHATDQQRISSGRTSPIIVSDTQESLLQNPPRASSNHFSASSIDHADVQHSDNADLGTLDYLTSHASNMDVLASAVQIGDIDIWSPETQVAMLNAEDSQPSSSPDVYSMYYPNAQYRELHSTLRQHMVETARSTALHRHSPAEPVASRQDTIESVHSSNLTPTASGTLSKNVSNHLKCDIISPRRQLELWRNYLNEIAPWLDMLDRDRHFQTTLPSMAKSAPHLHYSILSLSARQIERRGPERSYTESLGLYQQAIQLIVHRLQNLETEVIASCVLLCVLEMMSSSPRAWARHLDGCAMLLEAAGINGAVGGVRQAIFWCFARMDLWGGYLGDTITKIPINRWFIPSRSMAMAVSQFKDGSKADVYANYAVFLCASVVNVISTQEIGQTNRSIQDHSPSQSLYSTRWKALHDLLEDWHTDRPEELLPLMNEPAPSTDHDNPFPIVLYATSPGSSGNQMYHAASMLMLQHKPKDIHFSKSKSTSKSKPRKSILWHARQICGIATSNADHSAWTNALQPLWMAGKVMSHPSEHRAILDVLGRIERETGFATEWRADDLRDYWGDASE